MSEDGAKTSDPLARDHSAEPGTEEATYLPGLLLIVVAPLVELVAMWWPSV